MTIARVTESLLCPTCSLLGRKTNNEPCRTLDLRQLCTPCRRGLKTSYVGVVKNPKKVVAVDEQS